VRGRAGGQLPRAGAACPVGAGSGAGRYPRSPACWTRVRSMARVVTTGTCPSGTAGPKTGSATRNGRSTACTRAARPDGAVDRIWPRPGRCVAGAGCYTWCGMSSRPPRRWSALAGGCTEYRCDAASRTPERSWPCGTPIRCARPRGARSPGSWSNGRRSRGASGRRRFLLEDWSWAASSWSPCLRRILRVRSRLELPPASELATSVRITNSRERGCWWVTHHQPPVPSSLPRPAGTSASQHRVEVMDGGR
jgi:hypothetical protein